MTEIKIKPLSVNKAWQGRRYKTSDYRAYEQELWYLLPNKNISQGEIQIDIEIGVQKLYDIDNCLKPFLDILQKKYNFNDNMIGRLIIEKKIVKKGGEYIKFLIKPYKIKNCG